MDKHRLEAFSDGVIAIIITIMVLELKVPHGSELSDLRHVTLDVAEPDTWHRLHGLLKDRPGFEETVRVYYLAVAPGFFGPICDHLDRLDLVDDQVPPALRHRVRALGAVDEQHKPGAYASADVFVAPNLGGESFGIVLVEAMSAGTAVVASDLGAFRRVLDDGTAGTLFRTGDPDDLAAALVRVLGDDDLRERARAHASEVVERYDWSHVTREVLTVYKMVLAAGGRHVGADPVSRRAGLVRLVRTDRRER